MYKVVHKKLLRWYKDEGRHDLPWRKTDDAYHIWISEIMLQQTQVKTVLERFYFPFLEAFPTLKDLANATEDEVLKQWEGLGYYTRARNLHKAAKSSMPQLPKSVDELILLPGIGKSTAHAIAAFAYKTPVPILDANVKRILYRLFVVQTASDKELWLLANTFFDVEHPFEFNQAMMDIGATICQARNTFCDRCPLSIVCKGKREPLRYPLKKLKKEVVRKNRFIVVYVDNTKVALYQRETRLLKGMWSFYEYEDLPDNVECQRVGNIIQKYSHFHLNAEVYMSCNIIDAQYFEVANLESMALSGAEHQILKLLKKKQLI